MSEKVGAILIVLIVVLVAVILWGLLSGWIQELWERITGTADKIGEGAKTVPNDIIDNHINMKYDNGQKITVT